MQTEGRSEAAPLVRAVSPTMTRPQQLEKGSKITEQLGVFPLLTKQLDNQIPFQQNNLRELSTIRTSFSVAIPSSRNITDVRG